MPNQKLIEDIKKIIDDFVKYDRSPAKEVDRNLATAIAEYLEKNYEIKTKTPTNE